MTTKIGMLAIHLAKGSFQVCAIGADGAVLYNRVFSRTRLMTLLAEQPTCILCDGRLRHVASLGPEWRCRTVTRCAWFRRPM